MHVKYILRFVCRLNTLSISCVHEALGRAGLCEGTSLSSDLATSRPCSVITNFILTNLESTFQVTHPVTSCNVSHIVLEVGNRHSKAEIFNFDST